MKFNYLIGFLSAFIFLIGFTRAVNSYRYLVKVGMHRPGYEKLWEKANSVVLKDFCSFMGVAGILALLLAYRVWG